MNKFVFTLQMRAVLFDTSIRNWRECKCTRPGKYSAKISENMINTTHQYDMMASKVNKHIDSLGSKEHKLLHNLFKCNENSLQTHSVSITINLIKGKGRPLNSTDKNKKWFYAKRHNKPNSNESQHE